MKRADSDKYKNYYSDWQLSRIQKIEKIFGRDFFKGKTILEVACGYGDIGKHFREECGAILTFAEGREEHLDVIRENNPGCEVHHVNQELPWSFEQKFDVLIHFGVMYHLDNWKQDLINALKCSDIIILESEIADADGIAEYKIYDPEGYDQAINTEKRATRPTAEYVESVFKENGFDYVRYDDSDLNAGIHRYDWKVENTAKDKDYSRYVGAGMRRFWVARKS